MERTYYESELAIIQAITETWKYLTSSGWVVSGHLSEVCVVLYCNPSSQLLLHEIQVRHPMPSPPFNDVLVDS